MTFLLLLGLPFLHIAAGGAGRRDPTRRHREPRRLRHPADRVPARRDHADHHPGRRHGRPDRCRHASPRLTAVRRDADDARRRSTGWRARSRIADPSTGTPLSPVARSPPLYAMPRTSGRPASSRCSTATSAGPRSASTRSAPIAAPSRRRRASSRSIRAVDPGEGITTEVGGVGGRLATTSSCRQGRAGAVCRGP